MASLVPTALASRQVARRRCRCYVRSQRSLRRERPAEMIAVDSSAIVAIALDEAEAEHFGDDHRHARCVIGWPTLLETHHGADAARSQDVALEVRRQLGASRRTSTSIASTCGYYQAAASPSSGSARAWPPGEAQLRRLHGLCRGEGARRAAPLQGHRLRPDRHQARAAVTPQARHLPPDRRQDRLVAAGRPGAG